MEKIFAVIFKTKRNLPMPEEYSEMSKELLDLAQRQPGFLRIESVADTAGNGISVSYWRSLNDIQAWKKNAPHLAAQEKGKRVWYENYTVEICEVVRSYGTR